MFSLYNTLTKTQLDLGKHLHMYVCGPTVYAPIHIGNARAFALYRILSRYAAHRGLDVMHVSNITDINDKIDRGAKKNGVDSFTWAQKMEAKYKTDTDRFGLGRPDQEPRASEHIDSMYKLIQDLLDRDLAYATDQGNVYFKQSSYEDTGALSRRDLDSGQNQRHIAGDDRQHPADFALWKHATESPLWESPWGEGRPGWHLECSAMSRDTLGEHFHVHGGGRDLLFPHHEAERAQSKGAGDAHADLWWHTGLIMVRNSEEDKLEKGSKTDGNLPLLSDTLDEYGAKALLTYYLSAHPRADLEFMDQSLTMAKARYDRWENILQREEKSPADATAVQKILQEWYAVMDNDLDLPATMAFIESLLDQRTPEALHALDIILPILGLGVEENTDVPQHIQNLAKERQTARSDKDWARSDELREMISAEGWSVEDIPEGYRLVAK